jgi:hypothetical protein
MQHIAVGAPALKNLHVKGAKDDTEKVDLTLVTEYFPRALRAVAKIGDFGQRKYVREGWKWVPGGVVRYTQALLRHLVRDDSEPRFYQESPSQDGSAPMEELDHEAQVAWNALARLELILRG